MRLSRKNPVPAGMALLYEFVNSLDLRTYTEHGVQHTGGDGLATVEQLELWMRRRGLLAKDGQLDERAHRKALKLRDVLRTLLHLSPPDRRGNPIAVQLNTVAIDFPLSLRLVATGKIVLQPVAGNPIAGLGSVLAEVHHAAETANLDRLKMCASEECRWVFFDRSKPGTRRWCSSALCGNRQKTRAYRRRQQHPSDQA